MSYIGISLWPPGTRLYINSPQLMKESSISLEDYFIIVLKDFINEVLHTFRHSMYSYMHKSLFISKLIHE